MPQDIGPYALEVPGYRDRPDGPLAFIDLVNQISDLFAARDIILNALQTPVIDQGTTLPTAPYDGYLIDYRLSGGRTWHLRWDTIAGDWIYVGGLPLLARDTAEVHKSGGSSGYTDPDSGSGPVATAPLDGTYAYRLSAWIGGAGTADFCSMGVSINGASVDSDGALMNNNVRDASCDTPFLPAGHLDAGQTLVCKYRMDGIGNTGDYKNRAIELLLVTADG